MIPQWHILCLTLPTRGNFLARLKERIGPQVARHRDKVAFTHMVHDDNSQVGDARERFRRAHFAQGEYVNFVDDDDMVPFDYVDRILPLLDGVDYVGFKLQAYEDGKALPKPTFHSLLCGGWFESKYGYHRDISHLNPMKRDLALRAPIWGGFGEDSRWANDMRVLGVVKTEHYVEDVMYHYLSRTDKTDGVLPMMVTAGICGACGSESTVRVQSTMICNVCGASVPVL